jgi:nitronate monooxygenase
VSLKPTVIGTNPTRLHAPLSFGDASDYIQRIRDAGILVICQVQTVEMARAVLAQGSDVVIAQGTEAGGHGATRSTLPLVPAVVDLAAQEYPEAIVVAAGGIADGRGLAAALMLGAEGVMLGTRFVATPECLIDEPIRNRMVEASGDETLRSNVFDVVSGSPWPKEFTGRAVANAMSDEWHTRQDELTMNATAKTRFASAQENADIAYRTVWAGEALDMIQTVEPAGVIVRRIVAEAESALARRFA